MIGVHNGRPQLGRVVFKLLAVFLPPSVISMLKDGVSSDVVPKEALSDRPLGAAQ